MLISVEGTMGSGMTLSTEIKSLFGDTTKLNIYEQEIPLSLILPLMRFKYDAEKKSIINSYSLEFRIPNTTSSIP